MTAQGPNGSSAALQRAASVSDGAARPDVAKIPQPTSAAPYGQATGCAAAAPSVKQPRLNILLDAYNLEQPRGVGIKRYSVNLLAALRGQGHACGALFSTIKPVNDPLLLEVQLNDWRREDDEVYAVDPGTGKIKIPIRIRLRRRLRTTMTALRLASRSLPIKAVAAAHRVMGSEAYMADLDYYCACRKIYEAAFAISACTGRIATFRPPSGVDVWHATTIIPLAARGAANIVTVHDLIPLLLPMHTKDRKSLFLSAVKQTLSRADGIIAVSESSKADVVSLLGIAPDRIRVTYQPVQIDRQPLLPQQLANYLRIFGVSPGGYIFFAGAWEPKKNLARLFQALLALPKPIPLVMAGPMVWPSKEELELAQRLTERKLLLRVDFLPDEFLAALFQGARFMAFPSLYEGFGLPPLEAMAYGCPALVSNVGSLPEVCRQAAQYVDPTKLTDIIGAMEDLIHNDARIAELRSHTQETVAAMSPQMHSQRVAQAYHDFLD
jgi:glycosyltransferase involved in cell wall biosynthesis